MPMSKKHFEAVAAILREERQSWEGNGQVQQALSYVAVGLASAFSKANPRFDRSRFLEAARVPMSEGN
jgi:hypothetical protein